MQIEQDIATLSTTKDDQHVMNQSVAQNKKISPVDKKHSASSESSSETNVESEHPDAIGTPLMTATTSESGVQVGSSDEGRVQEKEISSKDQAKVSKGYEGLVGSVPTATRKAQSSEKKSFNFPEKVVSCIISHVFLLSMRDPVTSPVSERAPPFWTIAFQATPHLFPHFEYRWKLLRFASWLRDLQSVKDTWAAAVENHAFWATFLIQRPMADQKSEMGSSRGQETPAWLQRVHPGRKQAKNHSSLQSEAEKTCWLCVLHQGPAPCTGKLPIARTHIETTAFRKIPVCARHDEMPLCNCCLMWDNPQRNICLLTRQHDPQSFRLADSKPTEVCRNCRQQALEKAFRQYVPRFMMSPIPSSASQLYLEQGLGTAAAAVEHMHALAWATETLHLGLECAEELKKMKGGIRNDCLKRNQRCPNLTHITLPLDRINIVFSRTLGWEVDRMIDAGLWISPRTIADLLEEAARTHPSSDLSEFLPSIHVLEPPLRRPTTRKREWGDMTEEWAFKDRVPPRSVVTRMQRSYLELLPERIEGNLKSIRTMIARISDGNMDLAEAKAASMNVEELVQWLNDPRMHIPNWWHGQQIVKPISQSEIARALSSQSPMAESITKRKRDDSDLSDNESGKATKKQDNGISNNAMPRDSQAPMEVLPANTVGPPTPTGLETQATSPSTPRIESKPSLSILTPEIVNRLPWPTPQDVLSERECEYLQMTEFDETKLRNDAVYSVPASSTELDDVTRELLMYEWRSITECFSACRCSICRRAREYEKLVAAESANPYAEYISLLGGDAKIEDMSDFQRNWLANQAALLNSSVTSPEEDFEQDELQLTEEEDWPTMRNRNELESYSDEYDYESDEEMEEVPDVDDVAYHIPGARLQ